MQQQNNNYTGWKIAGHGAEAYERYIVPAWMGAWARHMVQAARIEAGDRVLDMACGTGVVAREAYKAVTSKGEVTGVDRDQQRLDAAAKFARQEGASSIQWRQGDALNIPLDTASCDVALCQQGLQFFPDKPAALQELARVLRPWGRVVLGTWAALNRCSIMSVLADIITENFGMKGGEVFHASCSLSERETLRALLENAGFKNIHIRMETKVARYPSIADFLLGYLSIFPFSASISALNETDRVSLFKKMELALSSYSDDDGLAAPLTSHIAAAAR